MTKFLQTPVVFTIVLSLAAGQFPQYGNNQRDENCCEDYCYTSDNEPYQYFSTKTSYEVLNLKLHYQAVAECQPIQFWSLNRHGSSYPDASTIERLKQVERIKQDIVRNYEQKRSYPDNGKLCVADYNLLKRWRWNDTITSQKAYQLTSEGINELKLIATRYRNKFSELFREPGNDRLYQFQYTDLAHDSYQAYIEGLFGSEYYRIHANTIQDDSLIQPMKNCRKWNEEVEYNPSTKSEYLRFVEREDYRQMAHEVFRRLGFRFDLNSSVLSDIYDLCRYEKAWNVDQLSPWCVGFTKKHLMMLEYAEDLKYYYETGYGNKHSSKLGCGLVKDMYKKFEDTINGNSEGNKVSAYFTHSATIQTVLTAMGINKDDNPLTADNYYRQSRRNWRTSLMDPFAANLVAVLYRCNRDEEQHKVLFLLNESPVTYEGCSVGLCSWSTVQNKLAELVENCNVQDFCEGNTGKSLKASIGLILVVFVVFFRM